MVKLLPSLLCLQELAHVYIEQMMGLSWGWLHSTNRAYMALTIVPFHWLKTQ